MKTKTIILTALAIGGIGFGMAISPASAAPVNVVVNTAIGSPAIGITKISSRRHVRSFRAHRRFVRRHNRRHGIHRNYRFGNYGIVAAKESTCAFYYRKAVTTGYRYWWVKYNHSCM